MKKSHVLINKNSIKVHMEKEEGVQVTLDNNFLSQVMEIIGVKQGECQGNQTYSWLGG